MLRSIFLAAVASVALALPGAATTVFSTNFSTDTPALNTTPGGFSVSGQVDIVGASNPYSITTPGGNVVDLDGSSGPGALTSLVSYAFNAGDKIVLDFMIGGAQRGSVSDDFFASLIFGTATAVDDFTIYGSLANVSFGSTLLAPTFTSYSYIAGSDGFASTGFSFTATSAGSLGFSVGTSSADNIGPLLAGVTLDITPASVPVPAAGGMMLLGLAGLAALRRKRA